MRSVFPEERNRAKAVNFGSGPEKGKFRVPDLVHSSQMRILGPRHSPSPQSSGIIYGMTDSRLAEELRHASAQGADGMKITKTEHVMYVDL